MTHSLHRFGWYHDLLDDYIVFAMPAKGWNDATAVEKQKEFLRRSLAHGPVNLGDGKKGGWDRPQTGLNPLVHWNRDTVQDPAVVIDGIDQPSLVTAVFDNLDAAKAFIAEIQEADLGLSVNISSLADKAAECCGACGIKRHSVEFSLGFRGATEKLPDELALQLTTMCGHGMVAQAFAQKMIDRVRAGRCTPEEGSRYLARFCVCSIYNPSRARRILEQALGAL